MGEKKTQSHHVKMTITTATVGTPYPTLFPENQSSFGFGEVTVSV